MTTQPQPEALRLANQLRDILPAFRTPSHERGVLNGAIQRLEQLHAECEALRADRNSWERQCSDRVDDAVEFLQQRDEARAECEALRASLRSERARADHIAEMLGDAMNQHILAMRAAVVDSHLRCAERGMQWIVNTLSGPGLLPDVDEAIELGGAQALFDKEMAEHDALRKTRRTIDAARAAKEQA